MKVKNEFKKGKATLALGEVSGHSHRFEQECMFRANDTGLATDVILEQDNTLIHEEHEPITMPKGEYTVVIQQEYDVLEGVRQVLD